MTDAWPVVIVDRYESLSDICTPMPARRVSDHTDARGGRAAGHRGSPRSGIAQDMRLRRHHIQDNVLSRMAPETEAAAAG
ncbi:hypothetical protein [Candidatus Poriferisodalis sp.]|uniref:hypothetical protein n=1 Tax=Candidatus Poriferisodalis sp. TaxID=3101277 RepID=UPI003B52564C